MTGQFFGVVFAESASGREFLDNVTSRDVADLAMRAKKVADKARARGTIAAISVAISVVNASATESLGVAAIP